MIGKQDQHRTYRELRRKSADFGCVQNYRGAKRYDPDGPDFDRPDRSQWALVLGLISLLIGPLGIIAWLVGNACLRAMAEGRMDPASEATAKAGRLLGIIATCMFAFKVIVLGIVLATGGWSWIGWLAIL